MLTSDPRWAYDILGLSIGASASEIRQAYRDLIAVWHPDRFLDSPRRQALATKKTQEINAAFALLRDLKSPEPSRSTQHAPSPPPPTPSREPPSGAYRKTTGVTGERYGRVWNDLNAHWQAAIKRGICPRCGPSGMLEHLDSEHRCTKCDGRFPSPPGPREPAGGAYKKTTGVTGERYGRVWNDLNAGWQWAIQRGVCPHCGHTQALERLDSEYRCVICDARFPLMDTA
jgi:curved DNA-binding protein CbpA